MWHILSPAEPLGFQGVLTIVDACPIVAGAISMTVDIE